ncbi:MAG: VOC family protein [Steroidobacteraceae bacterium]
MNKPQLGRIRCATLVTRDVEASSNLYATSLGYRIVERATISAALAAAWKAPAMTGARYAMLDSAKGSGTYLRWVECPDSPDYAPFSAFGWNALELTVQDCDRAAAQLARHGFRLAGPPEDLAFSSGALRAAQLQGSSGEVLYLTQIKRQLDGFQLPTARCLIDRLFIAILTGSSPEAGLRAYGQRFANRATDPFTTAVPVIARFQALDPQHPYRIGTLALAPEYYLEFDDAPGHVGPRIIPDGHLPPGIAMITLECAGTDTTCSTASAGFRPGGMLYGPNIVRRTTGPFGEWLELLSE